MTSRKGLMPAVKLFAYCLLGVLCTVLVVNTLRVPVGWGARSYSAEFTDVGGLGSGSEVTVAGQTTPVRGRLLPITPLVRCCHPGLVPQKRAEIHVDRASRIASGRGHRNGGHFERQTTRRVAHPCRVRR